MRGSLRALLVVSLFLSTGCASVVVQRVGAPNEPRGVRFYMPRPYVTVNEPFIVSSQAWIVGGELSPDGRHVLINDVEGDLEGHFKIRSDGTAEIASTRVLVFPEDGGAGGQPHGDSGEDDPPAPDPEKEGEDIEASPAKPSPGILNLKVSNDNSAMAMTPLKRYFDIVWLPDFEQQYVVRGRSGLGNAAIDLSLGQGWSLQGLEAHVDNSELAGRLYALMDEYSKILVHLGKTAVGLPPNLVSGAGPQGDLGTTGEVDTALTAFEGGTPLSLKVTVVKVVAPGIYPILKPSELAERNPVQDEKTFGHRILVPVHPYTNIAFNIYEAMVVEAVRADGDSALRLHQYVDSSGGGGPRGGRSDDSGNDTVSDGKLKGAMRLANRILLKTGQAFWHVTRIERKTDGGLRVHVEKKGTGEPEDDREDILRAVASGLQSQEMDTDPASVEIVMP